MTGRRSLEYAVLSVKQMSAADALAAPRQPEGSFGLMRAAGHAVAAAAAERFPASVGFDIMCGPGNNGGDGFVTARALIDRGLEATVFMLAPPATDDARQALSELSSPPLPIEAFSPKRSRVVVDALFGAGLTRPLDGRALAAKAKAETSGASIVAVDLPSGVMGDTGRLLGEAFHADLTVTFGRKKPAHLLFPGCGLCGEIRVADIGMPDDVIAEVGPSLFENHPDLWHGDFPWPGNGSHKYSRGHLAVCSGGAGTTGAARLSARSGARAGAGAVTLLSPPDAMAVNAAHLTAVMLREAVAAEAFEAFLKQGRCRAAVLGPGFGDLDRATAFALAALRHQDEEGRSLSLVLDADGITSFRADPRKLFAAAGDGPLRLVLTPHEGEFARLFPDLAADETLSKLEKTRAAAARAYAVVLLKGPDTVIAEPGGHAVINSNATPFLATAGSGDVLAGICGGLMAQGMPPFEAACAAAWLHAESGSRFGPGLIAEDLPEELPKVLRDLYGSKRP